MKARSSNKSLQRRRLAAAVIAAGLNMGAANAQNKTAPAAPSAQTQRPAATTGAALAGTVRTPDGKPVKDAAVFWIERARDGKTQRRFTVDTDTQGRFVFSEPLPQPGEAYVTLLVQAQEWGLTFQDAPADTENAKPLTITLRPAVALRVSFVDQAGKPVADLPVRVKTLSAQNTGFVQIPDTMRGRLEQRTNSRGECVFSGLPQQAQAQFGIASDAYAALGYEDAVTLGKTAAQQAAPIRVLRGGSVQGQVTDAGTGASVAGIQVGAQAVGVGGGWGEAVTDAQGNYRIMGLRPGAYNIALWDKAPRSEVTARALEKVDVQPGARLEHQDFVIEKGVLLTGKVTDKSTGKPVAGVLVGIYGPAHPRSGAAVQNATTDATGAYKLRVPAGAQYVYVMGIPDPSSVRYERPSQGVTITLKDDSATQDFALTPSLAQNLQPIEGQVVDANGKPLANVSVSVAPVSDVPGAFGGTETQSDANGAFRVKMTASAVRLRAKLNNMATESTTLAQSGQKVILRLKPNALMTIGGQVTDDGGKPLAGAVITLVEWVLDMGMGNVRTTSDAQGHYAFDGLYPDSRYSVSAEAGGYGTCSSEVTQYKPGSSNPLAALLLPRADSFVAGRVVDENGDPVAKQTVNLQGRANKFQQVITDAQGHFRFDGVVNEPLDLYLYDETGFSPPKKTKAGTGDVIFVRKPAAPKGAGGEAPKSVPDDTPREEASRKRQTALLAQPAPELKIAAWLNTKANMPDNLKGKIVLIDFWTVSCGPCVAALPAVQKISEQFAGQGVVVVGLHGSESNTELVNSFVRAHNLTYPIAIDMDDPTHQTFGQTMSGYGVLGIPTVAVLDRQGVVRYLNSGLDGALKVITDLLAGQK